MKEMIKIKYREFYDIPRVIYFTYDGNNYLLDCPFKDAKDDYSDYFIVYSMPNLSEQELSGSWKHLSTKANTELGKVEVSDVELDSTLRQSINSAILGKIK